MILDINKQLDEILKEELLQAEVITTECGKMARRKQESNTSTGRING